LRVFEPADLSSPSNGFFHPLPFAYAFKKLMKRWRKKSERERDNPRIFSDYYQTKWKRTEFFYFFSLFTIRHPPFTIDLT